jgi:hypothetical protein
MHAKKLHAREPGDLIIDWEQDRTSPAGEGDSHTPGMHDGEESDRTIVPMTPANKATEQQPEAAELAEGRVRAKENIHQLHRPPAQNGKGVSQGLAGVREAAPRERFCRHYPRQEPYALEALVRICAGGGQ